MRERRARNVAAIEERVTAYGTAGRVRIRHVPETEAEAGPPDGQGRGPARDVLGADKRYGASADPLSLARAYATLKATEDELRYLFFHLALCGGEPKEEDGSALSAPPRPEDGRRLAVLHAFSAAVQSIATTLSRRDRFKTLGVAMLRAGGSDSVV